MSEEEFLEDDRTNLAVERRIEIVVEVAKSVPPEIRGLVPEVSWRRITKRRDILAHYYFGARLDMM